MLKNVFLKFRSIKATEDFIKKVDTSTLTINVKRSLGCRKMRTEDAELARAEFEVKRSELRSRI